MTELDDLQKLDDRGLIEAIAGGNPAALEELHRRYSPMLTGLAQRVMGNPTDAEEVLQEALLQVWRQAGRYNPARSSPSTWLVLLTRSRAIDRLRSRNVVQKTVTSLQQEERGRNTSPEGARNVLHVERRKRVREELGRLPEEQRNVLELAFFAGMTQREIAEATGIPLGTVKTRTLLAMKKLRSALRPEIEELL